MKQLRLEVSDREISMGTVRVGISVRDCRGKRSGDAYTGRNAVTRIMIEEFPPPQQARITAIGEKGLKKASGGHFVLMLLIY